MGRACYAWNEGCSCHQGTPPEKERCPDSKDNLQQFLQHKARERIETNIRWKRRKYTHNGGSADKQLFPPHYTPCALPPPRHIKRPGRRDLSNRGSLPTGSTSPPDLVGVIA